MNDTKDKDKNSGKIEYIEWSANLTSREFELVENAIKLSGLSKFWFFKLATHIYFSSKDYKN